MHQEEGMALWLPDGPPDVPRQSKAAGLLVFCLVGAGFFLASLLATAVSCPQRLHVWRPAAPAPTLGPVLGLSLAPLTAHGLSRKEPAAEAPCMPGKNLIEYVSTLSMDQLRKHLHKYHGVTGCKFWNRTACMETLERLEGERWASDLQDFRAKLKGKVVQFCNSRRLREVETLAIALGARFRGQVGRSSTVALVRELESEEWAQHEAIPPAKKNAHSPEELAPQRVRTAEDEAELARRLAFYSTLNNKQLKRLLSARKETMFSSLDREGLLALLLRGDEEGKGLVGTAPSPPPPLMPSPPPSPEPGRELRGMLEILSLKDLRQMSRETGLPSALIKENLIKSIISQLEGAPVSPPPSLP